MYSNVTRSCIAYFCTVLTIALLTGCSSLPEIKSYSPQVKTEQEKIQNYEIGVPRKVYVGGNIIEKGDLEYTVSAEGKYRALLSRTFGPFSIAEGKLYEAMYVDQEDGSLYIKIDTTFGAGGVKVNKNGELQDSHVFYHNIGGWQGHPTNTVGTVGERIFERVATSRIYSPESFKVEIIYLGLSGADLKASYREYKNDIARPAFYQDLSYNLKDSSIIRYKNFRINILRATNEELECVVLED